MTAPRLAATALLLSMAAGCAANLSGLESSLEKEDWAGALALAGEDPEMQDHLAALILEREAVADSDRAVELVGYLGASGSPGKDALKRLRDRGGKAGDLAAVALEGYSPPSDSRVEELLGPEQIESDVRSAAACAWSRELGEDVLSRLVEDMDPRVRRCAVAGIAKLDGELSAKPLKILVRQDPSPLVRAAAAATGKALGGDAVSVLRAALEDQNMGVRHGALRGLGEVGDEEALALVGDHAAGPFAPTTVVAAAVLAGKRVEGGVDRFMEAFESERPTVRAAALTHLALARIEDADKVRLKMLEDESFQVALTAASALARDEENRKQVKKTLRRLADGEHPRAREALATLAVTGDLDAAKEMEKILSEGGDLEVPAMLRLAHDCAGLRDTFVSLLADPRREVRIMAARAVLS